MLLLDGPDAGALKFGPDSLAERPKAYFRVQNDLNFRARAHLSLI